MKFLAVGLLVLVMSCATAYVPAPPVPASDTARINRNQDIAEAATVYSIAMAFLFFALTVKR
jgi:hypothetical protein